MAKLYVKTYSSCEDSYCEDYDDPYSYSETYTSNGVDAVTLEKEPKKWAEEVPIHFVPQKGQKVYVVHAQWSTGDSFSNNHGYHHDIVAIYDNEDDAYTDCNNLENASGKVDLRCGHSYNPAWFGYFESLDWVEVSVRNVE